MCLWRTAPRPNNDNKTHRDRTRQVLRQWGFVFRLSDGNSTARLLRRPLFLGQLLTVQDLVEFAVALDHTGGGCGGSGGGGAGFDIFMSSSSSSSSSSATASSSRSSGSSSSGGVGVGSGNNGVAAGDPAHDGSPARGAAGHVLMPPAVRRVLNSKACRGAVMFGDELSLEQCRTLLAQLAKCRNPFQCAHGRPSAVPLLLLPDHQRGL